MSGNGERSEPETDGSGEATGTTGAEADGAGEAPDGATGRDQLAAAIEENPEAVAEFVDRLDAVNELLDVLALGEGAMTDEMVVELADTGSTLAESADGLATDGTVRLAERVGADADELAAAMESLVDLQRRGTLDDLVELAEVASLLSAALDDEMVVSLADTGSSLGELADTAAAPDTRAGLERVLSAVGAAERTESGPTGTLALLNSLRDDEVRQGLAYLVAVARGVGADRSDPATER
jgi:uncharacterized protein YjgD (DUF1641 family)